MLESLTHGFAVVQNGWTAFSLVATLFGLGGIGLIVLGVLAALYLPLFPRALRNLLVGTGIAVIIGAALFQAGQAKGAHEAFALDAKRAIAAETARADAAERVVANDRAKAVDELAAARADNARLKDLTDEALKRADAARVALPRDLARRLRAL